jgi:hypothetical protein
VDGVMKMSNFSDLENDIAGDWLAIQKKIQADEKREEELNSPKRPICTYKDFYRIIYQLFYDGADLERSQALHEILRMVLSGSERMPEGFERIWNALCNSYEHGTNTIECMSCGEHYDVLYKRTRPVVSYEFGTGIADSMMMSRHEPIYCPICSRVIGRLEAETFIGLTKRNIHAERDMEEGGNDFKYKF